MLSIRKELLICVSVIAFFSNQAFAQTKDLKIGGLTEGKHKKCISCHQSDPVKEIFLTRHADTAHPDTPASREECEACHGPSADHSNFPLKIRNFQFGKNSPNTKQEQNQACLRCHEEISSKEQPRRIHEETELTCANCHTVHREKDPLLDHTTTALICINCHDDKRPQQHIRGLHLIEVGRVACVDCHDPHAKRATATCVTCHKQDEETFALESQKARDFHRTTLKKGLSCLKCHSGISHGVPSWVEDLHKQQQETEY